MTERPLTRAATAIRRVLLFAAFILGIYVLKAVRVIFIPVIFAALLAVVVAPVQERLDAAFKGRYRAASLSVSMLLILLITGFFAGAILFTLGSIAGDLPGYAAEFGAYWDRLNDWIARHPLPVPVLKGGMQIRGLGERVFSAVTGILSSVGSFISALVVVFFLVLFILIELRRWKRKIAVAFPGAAGERLRTAVGDTAAKVRQFLVLRSGISALNGIGVGAWLAVFGVDSAAAWGALAFLTDYMPYIGAVIAVVPPAVVAFLQFGTQKALVIFAGLLLINQVIGNFVAPRVEGKMLTISPLVLLLSLVLWSWTLGIAGALLSVPLTIAFISVCDAIPSLKPLAELLKD